MSETGAVMRALDLARTGSVRSVEDIRRTLKKEGFESVDGHLTSHNLKKQLRAAINERILKEVG
ncbi:hypothetical protein [Sphingomonas aerophila]|uniref:Uncharacterized protein n=1 Tax=Sphingomonas aerophila TaxID=1344948 RepID=A0A7W9BCU5_9SPHN|nr:hypothetical protein [Sphingomonas aerophila]MBB5714781.1 hypothetical protein [Sphingomonas aerophila]